MYNILGTTRYETIIIFIYILIIYVGKWLGIIIILSYIITIITSYFYYLSNIVIIKVYNLISFVLKKYIYIEHWTVLNAMRVKSYLLNILKKTSTSGTYISDRNSADDYYCLKFN